MDSINFPYRSSSHLALMNVIAECGAWERHDLDVDFNKKIGRDDAHELVPKGEVEFVSGNHVSTYAARARGDTWEYLGQSVSSNNLHLVTRNDTGINSLEDCRLRKFGSRGRHTGLNTLIYLKQSGLDPDLDQVELVKEVRIDLPDGTKQVDGKSLFQMLEDGDVAACFMRQPRIEFAKRAQLKVIKIESQPMIFFMTLSSSKKMVDDHPDVVDRVLRAVLEGIAYFKMNREETIKILMEKHNKEGDLDRQMAEILYDDIAPLLEPKLYPSLKAISNVYQEALIQDAENGDAARIHPMALWNFHFLRSIDDSGFIDNLYKDHPEHLLNHGG